MHEAPSAHDSPLAAVFARMEVHFDLFDALLQELIVRLDGLQQDVPLHQRGFGIMEEPPA